MRRFSSSTAAADVEASQRACTWPGRAVSLSGGRQPTGSSVRRPLSGGTSGRGISIGGTCGVRGCIAGGQRPVRSGGGRGAAGDSAGGLTHTARWGDACNHGYQRLWQEHPVQSPGGAPGLRGDSGQRVVQGWRSAGARPGGPSTGGPVYVFPITCGGAGRVEYRLPASSQQRLSQAPRRSRAGSTGVLWLLEPQVGSTQNGQRLLESQCE
mmetsp:Transcript_6345/g.18242  ORF Transcript_6345/g.18242 Transcript_6345/m.18242 type:complete len:211 (+) Transcript_6345:160-792(+)